LYSILRSDIDAAIVELKNLLSEAEAMPIVMDEVSVLRAQLQLLEWSKQVRSICSERGSEFFPFKESKRFMEELDSIYSSVDKADKSEVRFDVQPYEEVLIRRTFDEGTKWLLSAKDVIASNGTLRKGIGLHRVSVLVNTGRSCTYVDLSAELKPLSDAVCAAETWREENRRLLNL